jgi:WD40 repeat protein
MMLLFVLALASHQTACKKNTDSASQTQNQSTDDSSGAPNTSGLQATAQTKRGAKPRNAGPTKAKIAIQKIKGTQNPRWRRRCAYDSMYSLGGVVSGTPKAGGSRKNRGSWVVVTQRKISFFDIHNGQHLADIKLSDGPRSVALSADGKTLAMGFSSGKLSLMNLKNKKITALPQHPDWVQDIAAPPQNTTTHPQTQLASVCQDGILKVFDGEKKKLLYTAKSPEKNAFYSVAFHPSAPLLAVGGYKQIHIFAIKKGAFVKSFASPGRAVRTLSFRPDGKRLVAASSSAVGIIDASTWKTLETLKAYRTPVAYGPKGRWLAMGTAAKQLAIRDVSTKKFATTLKSSAPPWRLTFAPDGRSLAVVQRRNAQLHVYTHDKRPNLGFWIPRLRWYEDDGPTLYVTLQVTGATPAATVAYGRLSNLKAATSQGNVKRISASPKILQGMDIRNRHYPGTAAYGFKFTVRLHGIPPTAKRLTHLQGDFLMRVSKQTKTLTIENPASLLDKSIVDPVLKKMGLTVRLQRKRKNKKALAITQKGTLGQLEAVSWLDAKGKSRSTSMTRIIGNLPSWSSTLDPAEMEGYKLQLHVNPKLTHVRGHFDIKNIRIPLQKKQ